MKINTLLAMTSAVVLFSFAACSDDDDNNELNATDQNFVMNASLSNTAEVDAGTLAAAQGSSAGVKMFGSMMVTEHGTAQTELKNLGPTIGMTINDTIDPPHVALKQQLQTLTGRAFDSTYIINQIADHQKTLTQFDNEISAGSHQMVRNYADKYRPHIQMHLHMADSIATAMNFK